MIMCNGRLCTCRCFSPLPYFRPSARWSRSLCSMTSNLCHEDGRSTCRSRYHLEARGISCSKILSWLGSRGGSSFEAGPWAWSLKWLRSTFASLSIHWSKTRWNRRLSGSPTSFKYLKPSSRSCLRGLSWPHEDLSFTPRDYLAIELFSLPSNQGHCDFVIASVSFLLICLSHF